MNLPCISAPTQRAMPARGQKRQASNVVSVIRAAPALKAPATYAANTIQPRKVYAVEIERWYEDLRVTSMYPYFVTSIATEAGHIHTVWSKHAAPIWRATTVRNGGCCGRVGRFVSPRLASPRVVAEVTRLATDSTPIKIYESDSIGRVNAVYTKARLVRVE